MLLLKNLRPQPASCPNGGPPKTPKRSRLPLPVLKPRPQTFLAIPVGAGIALAIHFFVPKKEIVLTSNYYQWLLFVILSVGLLLAALYPFVPQLRTKMRRMCPIFGVATLTLGVWELITTCLGLLPLPYFRVRKACWVAWSVIMNSFSIPPGIRWSC